MKPRTHKSQKKSERIAKARRAGSAFNTGTISEGGPYGEAAQDAFDRDLADMMDNDDDSDYD